MTFAKPEFLYGLVLLPLMFLFVMWAARRHEAALARLGDPGLVRRLSCSVNWRGRRWQTGLWFVALATLIISLARPQWGSEMQVVEQQGIEVMVALDVSNSMLAQDIKPDRLSRAKLEIADLMTRLGGDEIGLVLFSGASFIQFPLTSDYATARMFLDNARPEVISNPGTNIGAAIRTAMSGFDYNRASQKVIVLITDGEDHDANTMAIAQQAADQGIMLYTIGFGSPQGEPIPQYNDQGEVIGYKKDQNGEVVLSRLDEATLQQIADATGGLYFRAEDAAGLQQIYDQINQLEKSDVEVQIFTRYRELAGWFLLPALGLILIELLLRHTLFRTLP